jgi:MFS family permease
VLNGRIEVFYSEGGVVREGLYPILLAATTAATGGGMIGYHILSFWAGMLMLAVVYALATRLYGALAGVAALVLLVPNFWMTLLSRSIGNEALIPLLVAGALLALARAFPVYQPNRRVLQPTTIPFATLGFVLGLSLYTYLGGVTITLACTAFIVYMLLSRQPMPRLTLNYMFFAVLLLLIVAIPFVISSLRPDSPAGAEHLLYTIPPQDRSLPETVLASLGGIFLRGDANPEYNLPGRPLFDAASALLMLIGLIGAARFWRLPRYALPLIALAALLPAALLTRTSPSFLSYTPLLPLFALLFANGVKTLYSSAHRRAQPAMLLLLAALFIANLAVTTQDLFRTWRNLPEVQTLYNGDLNALAHYLDRTADDLPTVVCAPSLNPSLSTGETWGAARIMLRMMNRSERSLRFADCLQGLVLANGGERQQIIFPEPAQINDMHPYLRTWIDQGTPLEDPALPSGSVILLDVQTALADQIGMFTVTNVVTFPPEPPGNSERTEMPVSFGGNVTFLGYQGDPVTTYRPTDIFSLYTYWRVDGVVPADWSLITHLLFDPGAAPAAQRRDINVLPSYLQPRDIVVQVLYVALPETMPAGEYAVSLLAVRTRSENARLEVFDRQGQPRGDRIFLAPMVVEGQ